MVTPSMAKRHRDDLAQAEYLNNLGHAPTYTGVSVPPITAETVFGSTPSPPLAGADDDMDIDDIPLIPVELSPFPPITNSGHHLIPEDDFQPDSNLGDRLHSPEPYNEDLENSALEEESQALENPALRDELGTFEDSTSQEDLQAFGGVRYGQLPIVMY